MTLDQIVESTLKLREILALGILGGVIWIIVSRLIPMLIAHKDQRLADALNTFEKSVNGMSTAINSLSASVQGNTTVISHLEEHLKK